MKKLISLVLAIAMLVSLVPTLALATEAEPQAGNTVTLFDFGNTATHSTAGYSKNAAKPSALAFEGKDASLRWEMDITSTSDGNVSNTPELDLVYTASDLSTLPDDAVINVRFYSENAGSKFNLVYFGSEGIGWKDTDDDGASDLLVSYNEAVEIDGGWQVHSMLLGTLLNRFRNYEEDNKITVRFNDDGWSNLKNGGYKDGDTVYIDEIWVDANTDAYYDALAANASGKVIWKSEDGVSIKSGETVTSVKHSPDKERGLYTDIISKETQALYLSTDNCVDSDGTESYTSLFDCSDSSQYKYLNAWVYSESAQDAGIVFSLETKPASNAYVDGTLVTSTSASITRYAIPQVDWTGWKLVSLSLADDIDSTTSANKGKVLKVRIDVNKWKGQKLTNLLGSDSNGDGANDIAFGIDGVWVSETSAQAAYEESLSYGNKSALNANVIWAKDFNTKSSLIRKQTSYHVTNDLNADYNPYNSRLYDMSARLSFNSVEYNDILNLSERVATSKMASLQVKDRSKKTDEDGYADNPKIVVNSNSYVNAWVYNPEPKYTFDGKTPAEFLIVLGHRGSEGTASVTYHAVAVAADWSGWKLISIPVTTWNNTYTTYGIYQIYISCNMDNYPRNTDGNALIISRTDAQKEAGYASLGKISTGTAHNVFARQYSVTQTDGVISAATSSNAVTNANLHNYIDVERVWITDGPATEELNVTPADNSAIRCSQTDSNAVTLFTAAENTVANSSVNVIKTVGNTTSKVNATYANGVLTLPSFEYGASYSVVADITGTNGVKTKVEFAFANEDIHVGDIVVDGKTATITMHGNLGNDYANSKIIAAVYTNSSCDELEAAYVGIIDANGNATVTIPAETDTTGKTVRFFFFNNTESIKPLEFDIQK